MIDCQAIIVDSTKCGSCRTVICQIKNKYKVRCISIKVTFCRESFQSRSQDDRKTIKKNDANEKTVNPRKMYNYMFEEELVCWLQIKGKANAESVAINKFR